MNRIRRSRYEEILINEIITPCVINVRKKLEREYDVSPNGRYPNYVGLCDNAISLLGIEIMKWNPHSQIEYPIYVHKIHGEQAHHPRLKSKYWCYQHSWMVVEVEKIKIYVDPTSQQFQKFYDDIPQYYIGFRKPKWFYADRDNPAWNGLTRKLNEKIILPHYIEIDGEKTLHHEGLIEFLQHGIWGNISDFLHEFYEIYTYLTRISKRTKCNRRVYDFQKMNDNDDHIQDILRNNSLTGESDHPVSK